MAAVKFHKHYNCDHHFPGRVKTMGLITDGPFPTTGTDQTSQPPLVGEMRGNSTKLVRWTGSAWVQIAWSSWS